MKELAGNSRKVISDMSRLPLNQKETSYEPIQFGKEMLKQFLFDPAYRNLNHGSFGAFPRAIRDRSHELRDLCESRPDPFIRYTYPKLLDESREAVAQVLNVPVSTIVFIANATTGTNTVLRNLVWNPDGKDEILYFSSVYGALGKTIAYVCEAANDLILPRRIDIIYPLEDADLLAQFKDAITTSRASGRRPRIAVFDTVVSFPGVRTPFEALTSICRSEGILSLVDGAQAVGHIKLDLSALDPDFFVSNCHKWLFTPRGCAVFYVPERHQASMRSTVPTSHGFVPLGSRPASSISLQPNSDNKSEFVESFEFVGSADPTPFLCVTEAIKWRREVCGGEDKVIEYCTNLVREGARAIAATLGTKVMDNSTHTLSDCCLAMVLLPIDIGEVKASGRNKMKPAYMPEVVQWMMNTLMEEYDTYLAISYFQGAWWVRLSGQVYMDMEDFEWAGEVLKELCDRLGRGEYLKEPKKTMIK